jgi:hypothetical protein
VNDRDRLFTLLPVVHRMRDAQQGYPLRALLQVIAEQVNLVEEDIEQLYENWFVETAEEWVVPYIGDLVGYQPLHGAGEPTSLVDERDLDRLKILVPRVEVANTLYYRRRKGTLYLLELLANQVAGWPARAVEFYRLLAYNQALDHLQLRRGRTADLRDEDALQRLAGPFDEMAHTVDVRANDSLAIPGYYNIPSVGLFVWRLRSYSVTQTPAYQLEQAGPNCFTFSALGHDAPLYARPQPETAPTDIAAERNLPVAIRRRAFELHVEAYYGPGKSLYIWLGQGDGKPRRGISARRIVATDLSGWQYEPERGKVAVDPELGRIAFHPREIPRQGVWVSYHYGFSADLGGGEYPRPIAQVRGAEVYRVGEGQAFGTINEALDHWQEKSPADAVVEIADSAVYVEPVTVRLVEGRRSLQLRAARGARPILRLLDWQTDRPDSLWVTGDPGSRFVLDGLLVSGRGMQVQGPVATVTIRHSTLVPGWSLHPDCEPRRPAEPSLELIDTTACVVIEHSILGSIQVNQDEVGAEPLLIYLRDSILDATSPEREALGAPNWRLAHAVLTVERSTVFGQVQTHAIELAEDSILVGKIRVARRQRGCMRFCSLTLPSRTPRRYHCQPDLVLDEVNKRYRAGELGSAERDRGLEHEAMRVLPRFNSVRYGTPTYCQLATACASEILRGASDESEMGVFHDLYQPQRAANLRARLDEAMPAGMQAGILIAS